MTRHALARGEDGELALALVSTIRHDGHGGVADDFADDEAVRQWVAEHCTRPADAAGLPDAVREIRRAARALFAMTVRPAPPSRADSRELLPDDQALAVLTAAVDAAAPATEYDLSGDRVTARRVTRSTDEPSVVRAMLALAVLDFLCGPNAERLRSCQAPRCVRYFIRHGRQAWCKDSCGNRARVARHAARTQH
ncbi:ABATE domain-containing protein [Luteipulveratus halotolerans]|uniref:Zinc finger CGNR domain-containing protein n=1 Tax=Luteipulveratus halotolerans TaxID=1631356 RepID=A0A0L6CF91_9MICO|nr:ABATE domain-containing protein [Luteipulveratus halotolerans]KNX36260.1 hypothetical protein VV01_02465 [Luteipulveratus halotolerans]